MHFVYTNDILSVIEYNQIVKAVIIMKYIRSDTTTGESETIYVSGKSDASFDISKDTDNIRYSFDTFEDYMRFANHIEAD